MGHEFGVTTGRKRRCGWFDAVIARYAAEVNGLTDVALTKLDVLSAFDTIKVCTAYECEGKVYDYFPMQQSVLFHAKPVYEELPGWKGVDITECRTFEELPENAQRYVEYLEKITGVPVSIIAVAPIATRPSCEAGIGNVPPFCRTAERLDAAKRRCPRSRGDADGSRTEVSPTGTSFGARFALALPTISGTSALFADV